MKVTVIFTCFNRKDKSVSCVKSLAEHNPETDFQFIVVDDNSSDGTKEALAELNYEIEIITGNGSLFWAGGMRKGIGKYLSEASSEYVLLVNDDVRFYPGIVEKLISESKRKNNAVIVGATCDDKGDFSYGAMQLIIPRKKDLYRQIRPSKNPIECDTFNCNCVLIKSDIISQAGNFDSVYTHSLADLDYGLKLRRMGYHIYSSEDYVGVCNKNGVKGTWADSSLSRIDRFKKKESPKGAPYKEWFHFMKKNFGVMDAIKYSISPYARILLGR